MSAKNIAPRQLNVVHLLIRSEHEQEVRFLLYPHAKWINADAEAYLTMPSKKSVTQPFANFLRGTSLEEYIDVIMQQELGVADQLYVLEQELPPVYSQVRSPTHQEITDYTIYPVDIWVAPKEREPLCQRLNGEWQSPQRGVDDERVSPTARETFRMILKREEPLAALYKQDPSAESKPEAQRRLLQSISDKPTGDALAKRWFAQNKSGVRHLSSEALDTILGSLDRAFNLRVADPYLRYQMQGVGFTWSFFTHKDKQDLHVHGAHVVEIYGVLQGRMEIWWKPYYDRGTSAWNHRVLESGDWIEVDSLQCHIVRWLSNGKGVVFKGGIGPLAEVGKLGVKGKTPCEGCPCIKPKPVCDLLQLK